MTFMNWKVQRNRSSIPLSNLTALETKTFGTFRIVAKNLPIPCFYSIVKSNLQESWIRYLKHFSNVTKRNVAKKINQNAPGDVH